MIGHEDLVAAVRDGTLTQAQADRLIARANGAGGAIEDDEKFRVFNGFNDVFLALGVALIAVALTSLWGVTPEATRPLTAGVAVLVLWALAELLVGRYRVVLPAIAINLGLAVFVLLLVGDLLGADRVYQISPEHMLSSGSVAGTFAVVLAFNLLFYWRFKLPFTLAAIGGSGVMLAIALIGLRLGGPGISFLLPNIFLGAGIILFGVGVAYDVTDPPRVTRRADCAFWLHILAAPLMAHGLLSRFVDRLDAAAVIVIVGGFLVLAVVSLVIDRRAPLVSSLAYLGVVIGYAIAALNGDGGLTIGVTLLALGTIVVAMGTAWRWLRRLILAAAAQSPLGKRLPPLRA